MDVRAERRENRTDVVLQRELHFGPELRQRERGCASQEQERAIADTELVFVREYREYVNPCFMCKRRE